MTLQRSDTQRSDPFDDARKAFLDKIEVTIRRTKDEHDRKWSEEEFYLSSAPKHAVEAHKDVIEHLYKVSMQATNINHSSTEQDQEQEIPGEGANNFWESVKPRAQLLTILLKLGFVKEHSALWTDFVADHGQLGGLKDSCLPLNKQALAKYIQPYEGRHDSLVEDFKLKQLQVCAVKFENPLQMNSETYYEDRSACFDKGDHLPLLEKLYLNKGSSAKVYRIKFADEHFRAKATRQLAMKQFRGNNAGVKYMEEWEQSQRLHENDRRHVGVLAACAALKLEYGGLLFFPLADFDLWQYMNTEGAAGPQDHSEKLMWLQQLSRVADALTFLHERQIAHGDVKSENTLVTIRTPGARSMSVELYIADFGNMLGDPEQSTSHALALSDKTSPKRKSIGDGCHNRAPKLTGSKAPSGFTGEADVWGFGTVLSETLAWFSLGKQSLDSFEEARFDPEAGDNQYFSINTKFNFRSISVPKLRLSISEWLGARQDFARDLKTRKLHRDTWKLVVNILNCDYKSRTKIEQVRKELMLISTDLPENGIDTNRASRLAWRHKSPPAVETNFDQSAAIYEKLRYGGRDDERNHNELLVETAKLEDIRACLDRAIEPADFRAIELLLPRFKTGVDIIHRAVESGSLEFLKQLPTIGEEGYDERLSQDLDQPGSQGLHPLLKAVTMPKHVRTELVEQLLRLGANVNVSDSQGETSLHYAARLGLHDIVKLLIDHEADVNAKDNCGVTPLHVCASVASSDIDRNHEKCVGKLLESGANKNTKDDTNRYPLHYALRERRNIERDRWPVLRLLCEGTSGEMYVQDIIDNVSLRIRGDCVRMWQECNPRGGDQ